MRKVCAQEASHLKVVAIKSIKQAYKMERALPFTVTMPFSKPDLGFKTADIILTVNKKVELDFVPRYVPRQQSRQFLVFLQQ